VAKVATKALAKSSINYSRVPYEIKARLLGHIFVEHPRLKILMRQVEQCHQYSMIDEDLDPEGMLITGFAGVGKSKFIRRYAEKFPWREEVDKTIVPVLVVTIPQSATVKSLVSELLDALGDPFPDRGSAASQTRRLKKLIRDCGVELIIADEFQHFIDKESDKVLHDVSDWLKVLMDKTRKPIILSGLPNSDKILEANEQLKRRFTLKESLEPFGWKSGKAQDTFRQLLRQIDDKLPFNERANLSDPQTAFQIYYATRGIIGYVMKLVRVASIRGLRQTANRLNADMLAYAYEKNFRKVFPKRVNPFKEIDLGKLRIEPVEERRDIPGATNGRVRANKAQPKAADVLRRRG